MNWIWTDEQLDALDLFQKVMESAINQRLLKFKGLAGTGKTTLLQEMARAAGKFFPDPHSVLVLAPTRAAATIIGGRTVHSALVLAFSTDAVLPYEPMEEALRNIVEPSLLPVRVVLIDVANMVGAHLLYKVDQRLREVGDAELPFGGRIVVLFADASSWGPVGHHLQDIPYTHILKQFDTPWTTQLDGMFRGGADSSFRKALRRLSQGLVTPGDLLQYAARQLDALPAYEQALFQDVPMIVASADDASAYTKELREHQIPAVGTTVHKLQSKGVDFFEGAMDLWVGARVVLTTNVVGVASAGALCQVKEILPSAVLLIRLEGGSTFSVDRHGNEVPVRFPTAMTLPKSMGFEFDKVVVILPKNNWGGARFAYAAISRANGWRALAFKGPYMPESEC